MNFKGGASIASLAFLSFAALPARADDPVVPAGCEAPTGVYDNVYHATPTTFPTLMKTVGPNSVVYLAPGNYGSYFTTQAYPSWVTVTPEPGATVTFDRFQVKNSSHLILSGLTVTSLRPVTDNGLVYKLFTVDGGDNIVIDNNTIASTLTPFPWAAEPDDMYHGLTPLTPAYVPASGLEVTNVHCAALTHNHIYNVWTAIKAGGDHAHLRGVDYLVYRNWIDNFSLDAIDHSASNLLIALNTVTNSHTLCADNQAVCPHTDFIQGQNYNNWTYIPGSKDLMRNSNVNIDDNVLVIQLDPAMIHPNHELHGIFTHNGWWSAVDVSNNVIITQAYEGIVWQGVDGLVVKNNTMLTTDASRPAWIRVGGPSAQGAGSTSIRVYNNIFNRIKYEPGVVADIHDNVDLDAVQVTPQALFPTFDPVKFIYHLRQTTYPDKGSSLLQ